MGYTCKIIVLKEFLHFIEDFGDDNAVREVV